METALKDNPGLKLASARLREAQGFVRVEGARLLPFLEADASLTYERISQHGVFAALNPEVAGARILLGVINPLSFRYEFDFWGKNRAMLEAALGQAAAEEAERAEVRLRLTTGIARAYFRGHALHRQLELGASASSIFGATFASSPKPASSSAWTMNLAVKQAIADYEAAVKRQAGVRDQLDVQRHLLARLAGKGPGRRPHVCSAKPESHLPTQFLSPNTCRWDCWCTVRIWPQRSIEPIRRRDWSKSPRRSSIRRSI